MSVTTEKPPHERLTHEHVEVLERITGELRQTEAPLGRDTMSPGGGAQAKLVGTGPGPEITRSRSPRLGQIVTYRARSRGYRLPAIVTATIDTLDPRGVVRGDVPALTSEENVHLNVQSCGDAMVYQEHDVPFSADEIPGTWGWQS